MLRKLKRGAYALRPSESGRREIYTFTNHACMLPQHALIERLRALGLPPDDFVLFGSVPMWVKGLKTLYDIEIVARGSAWERVCSMGTPKSSRFGVGDIVELEGGLIEVYNGWGPGEWDVHALIDDAEVIDGFRVAKLEHVMRWKRTLGRPKDLEYVELIKGFLKKQENMLA